MKLNQNNLLSFTENVLFEDGSSVHIKVPNGQKTTTPSKRHSRRRSRNNYANTHKRVESEVKAERKRNEEKKTSTKRDRYDNTNSKPMHERRKPSYAGGKKLDPILEELMNEGFPIEQWIALICFAIFAWYQLFGFPRNKNHVHHPKQERAKTDSRRKLNKKQQSTKRKAFHKGKSERKGKAENEKFTALSKKEGEVEVGDEEEQGLEMERSPSKYGNIDELQTTDKPSESSSSQGMEEMHQGGQDKEVTEENKVERREEKDLENLCSSRSSLDSTLDSTAEASKKEGSPDSVSTDGSHSSVSFDYFDEWAWSQEAEQEELEWKVVTSKKKEAAQPKEDSNRPSKANQRQKELSQDNPNKETEATDESISKNNALAQEEGVLASPKEPVWQADDASAKTSELTASSSPVSPTTSKLNPAAPPFEIRMTHLDMQNQDAFLALKLQLEEEQAVARAEERMNKAPTIGEWKEVPVMKKKKNFKTG